MQRLRATPQPSTSSRLTMNTLSTIASRAACAAAWGLCASMPAMALDANVLDIHGYGHQLYLQTSKNAYLGADKDGSFQDNLLALVVTASVAPKTKVWAQITANSGESFNADWFYVDHTFDANWSMRIGKALLPVGFYNEIVDARLLQKSSVLPLVYQPDTDLVDEAFGGVGGTWTKDTSAGRLNVDAFGGHIVEHAAVASSQKQKGLVGFRIDYAPPIEGLRLMVSAAAKTNRENTATADTKKNYALLSAEWARNNLDLKAEYGRTRSSTADQVENVTVYYVQAGYDLNDAWSVFGRYDSLSAPALSAISAANSQKTFAAGVTYKLNGNISLRLENHFNKGYAAAVMSGEVAAGAGRERWNLMGASVNFIF
jgi:hypothetical protein